jgi:hypothetical protein
MAMDVSIIIINYNTKKLTEECIDSIYEKVKAVTFEVIVIDNASTDGSKEVLSKLKNENCRYVYKNENLGFSKANNIGAELAKGQYLFFMNSDMLLLNDVPKLILDKFNTDKKIGIIGPKFLNPDHSLQISCRNFPSLIFGFIKFFPFLKYIFKKEYKKYYKKDEDYNSTIEVDTVSAGALIISRDLFFNIGKFDEISFMYGEDADICKRVRDKFLNILFCPEAFLIHYGGQSSKLNSNKAIWSYYLAFYFLYKKYYFGIFAIFIKPVFILRAYIAILLNIFKKDKRVTWSDKN